MSRPRKHRRLRHCFQPTIYKPVGTRLRLIDTVVLLPEELEALRLAEIEGLYQEEASTRMGVARSTFQRIMTEAHYKVTKALVEGKALQIYGVDSRGVRVRWYCFGCGRHWEVLYTDGYEEPDACPSCGSKAIRESGRRRYARRHGGTGKKG